ncbi:MAG: hypothetical protein QXP01_08890 [Candidatus Hadarchaeum sp.]
MQIKHTIRHLSKHCRRFAIIALSFLLVATPAAASIPPNSAMREANLYPALPTPDYTASLLPTVLAARSDAGLFGSIMNSALAAGAYGFSSLLDLGTEDQRRAGAAALSNLSDIGTSVMLYKAGLGPVFGTTPETLIQGSAGEANAVNVTEKGLGDVTTSPWLADRRSGVRLHLEEFRDGGSFVMTKEQYELYVEGQSLIGRTDGVFITTSNFMDRIFAESAGDFSIMERRLGFNPGYFADQGGLVRIDVDNPLLYNIRMPSGLESGANTNFRWGGYTSGGVPEAVIDPIPNSAIKKTMIVPK